MVTKKLSIVDGGFDQWTRNGFEVSQADVRLPHGNWTAKDNIALNNIKFEEMEAKEGEKQYMDQTDKINFLDSRIRGQFNGTQDTGLDPYRVAGSNIPGFKNIPAAELVDENGVMKSPEEIRQYFRVVRKIFDRMRELNPHLTHFERVIATPPRPSLCAYPNQTRQVLVADSCDRTYREKLYANGYQKDQPVVTICNTGMQAAMLAYAIDIALPGVSPRVYNGSLKEMELRDPKKYPVVGNIYRTDVLVRVPSVPHIVLSTLIYPLARYQDAIDFKILCNS
ncbi:hypothetical protein KIN20_005340 [Parelaphostrongylus tenuis]|uniref:Rhodanese domain-containing protein n=1 Tax=Parelaphostrongylus tenuis TaxID=148309 RepID=A0AAD5MIF4_PARTN|nr:hypothetical protein KIN20_005340 [Parelaphostrongylus tenuis]